MTRKTFLFSAFSFGMILSLAGCATTRPKPADPSSDLSARVAQLQSENQAKDQQIQDLQTQLSGTQESIQTGSNFSSLGKSSAGKSKWIHVPGVSVKDLQKALSAAGFDPGHIDGNMGKKTKSAIKAFQKKNNLKNDGVVGEKTWALLKK